MTCTKAQIVKSIYNQIGLPKNKSRKLGPLIEVIKKKLAAGVVVLISNFCKFCVRGRRNGKAGILQLEMI